MTLKKQLINLIRRYKESSIELSQRSVEGNIYNHPSFKEYCKIEEELDNFIDKHIREWHNMKTERPKFGVKVSAYVNFSPVDQSIVTGSLSRFYNFSRNRVEYKFVTDSGDILDLTVVEAWQELQKICDINI